MHDALPHEQLPTQPLIVLAGLVVAGVLGVQYAMASSYNNARWVHWAT